MTQRYSEASELTAPRVAARTPGIVVEGYWLDSNRFYFLAERYDPSLGRILATPSIAVCNAQRVEELVPLEALSDSLSDYSGKSIDLAALSSAAFDMPDPNTLAVSVQGQHYLVDVRERRVVSAEASLQVPALYSPNGRFACFVKGHDLWLKERGTGNERPLTTDGAPHYAYGRQPESCLAAVSYRKYPSPMGLWSPDSQWFFTHRIDERAVPELALVQHAPPDGGRPILHRYRYPMPGDPLPVVIYQAIHVASGRIVTFNQFPAPALTHSPFYRFRRATWFSGRNTAWFLRIDRYYKQTELIRLDLEQGAGRVLLSETADTGYLEFNQIMGAPPNVRVLESANEIIGYSERDGWGHLYLYDGETGALRNQITQGPWMVRDIVHVDERERKILLTACGIDPQADPARRALCSVSFDGGEFEILLTHDGDLALPKTEPYGSGQDRPFFPPNAQTGVSPGRHFAPVLFESVECGNITRIVDLQTRHAFTIASALPATNETRPRHFDVLAADGTTRLYGVMFFPSDFDATRRYPLIDYIYPGPQIPQQPQSFRSVSSCQARALAELGFVTVMLDTRGMPLRSRALHQASYGELLEPPLADHAAAMRQLCERHAFLDAGRIGIFGQSGGGFAAARALFDYGETFKVGVSVCGNHDNNLNIATWSDKYRGPGNPTRWAAQANGAAAHKLQGKLLLISGDMDENVHVSQTLRLADALIQANRDFDLLIVPNEGHLLLLTNGYVLRRMWDYFVRHLLGETPPEGFEIRFQPQELARCEASLMREFWQ
jgi:dienelactone hydrolase